MDDLDLLAAVARRARRRLRQGVFRRLLPPERQEVQPARRPPPTRRWPGWPNACARRRTDAGASGPARDS